MVKIIIVTVVLIVVFGGYFLVRMFSRYQKRKLVKSVLVVIIDKTIDKWKGSPGSPQITEYYVVFDIEGAKLNIKVPNVEDYENLTVGEKGTLTYQQNILNKVFVNFERI